MNKDIIKELTDYMFTANNLRAYTKHMIQISTTPNSCTKNIDKLCVSINAPYQKIIDAKKSHTNDINLKSTIEANQTQKKYIKETTYRPKQKDSLFWCLYILKHGYSNYEMEINNRYFSVEKQEKFNYIEMLRKNKDIIKLHKIKPFTELEDDLANKDKISIKTFFALCILENINILLVDNRKIFELTCVDIDEEHRVNVIHRNKKNGEHYIELDVTDDILQKYRDTYYVCNKLDDSIKSMSSYKLEDLIDICKKLNINIEQQKNTKKKLTKKDIYELLILNY